MTERSWVTEYNAACVEMDAAKEQYRVAQSALAVAQTRFNHADRELSRLFRERAKQIEGCP